MAVARLVIGSLLAGTGTAELPVGFPSTSINGVEGKVDFPMFGIGTWQFNSSRTQAAVELAFSLGYRHVDTAYLYENQVGVGNALRNIQAKLDRKSFFVTSKIPGGLNASASRAALDTSLEELGLGYVDLMLLHTPFDDQGHGSPAMRKEQWEALQEWALRGKAKAIGVSHYCRHHLDDVLSVSKVPVAVNQVQYHVGMGEAPATATDDKAYMEAKGTLYQSFSPLCGPCAPPHNMELKTGPLVTGIGNKYGKTGAQVALKWLVQQGIPVIPKSDREVHLQENMDLWGWTLSDEDMHTLTSTQSPPVAGGPSDTDSGDCGISQESISV